MRDRELLRLPFQHRPSLACHDVAQLSASISLSATASDDGESIDEVDADVRSRHRRVGSGRSELARPHEVPITSPA